MPPKTKPQFMDRPGDSTPMSRAMIEDHTERLRDLEKVPAQVAVLDARVEGMDDRLKEVQASIQDLSETSTVVAVLDQKFDQMHGTIADLVTSMKDVPTRLASLEQSRQSTRQIRKWVGGVVAAVLVAAIAFALGLN